MSPFYWSSMCLSHCFSSTAFHPVTWCREIRSCTGEEQLVENRKGWKKERERRTRRGKRTDEENHPGNLEESCGRMGKRIASLD